MWKNLRFYFISKIEILQILEVPSINISNILYFGGWKNIKDFTSISQKMKFLDDSNTNVSDVSFLKKIKIKELNLYACINIKNFFLYLNEKD